MIKECKHDVSLRIPCQTCADTFARRRTRRRLVAEFLRNNLEEKELTNLPMLTACASPQTYLKVARIAEAMENG